MPSSCLPKYTDNDVPGSVLLYPQEPMITEQTSCFFEKRLGLLFYKILIIVSYYFYHIKVFPLYRFYKEGVQWRDRGDKCTMCHCYRALIRCDKMPCPILECLIDQQITLPDECCPICTSMNTILHITFIFPCTRNLSYFHDCRSRIPHQFTNFGKSSGMYVCRSIPRSGL